MVSAVPVSLTRLLASTAYWSSKGAVVVASRAWSISAYWISVTMPALAPLGTTPIEKMVLPAEMPAALRAVDPTIRPLTLYRLICTPLLSSKESLPSAPYRLRA
ncbi:hypothetical protein D3C81_1693910 [compost metagenome]